MLPGMRPARAILRRDKRSFKVIYRHGVGQATIAFLESAKRGKPMLQVFEGTGQESGAESPDTMPPACVMMSRTPLSSSRGGKIDGRDRR